MLCRTISSIMLIMSIMPVISMDISEKKNAYVSLAVRRNLRIEPLVIKKTVPEIDCEMYGFEAVALDGNTPEQFRPRQRKPENVSFVTRVRYSKVDEQNSILHKAILDRELQQYCREYGNNLDPRDRDESTCSACCMFYASIGFLIVCMGGCVGYVCGW